MRAQKVKPAWKDNAAAGYAPVEPTRTTILEALNSMGINVAWVNERHEEKQLVADPQRILSRLAISRWSKLTSSVCLQFVVPWGDAVFNQAQNSYLQNELAAELREARDPQVRNQLQKVIRLVELAQAEVHTYIKFIGD